MATFWERAVRSVDPMFSFEISVISRLGSESRIWILIALVPALSPTGSALARTDLSPLTNWILEIHAGYSCFLHLQHLAKIG